MTAQVRLRHVEALYMAGRLAEATTECEDARTVLERTLGPRHPLTIRLRLESAVLRLLQGGIAEAEATLRSSLAACDETLPSHSPYRIFALTNLCHLLLDQGRDGEAEAMGRALGTARAGAYGADSAPARAAGNLIATALVGLGRAAEAIPLAAAAADVPGAVPPIEPCIVLADAHLALGDRAAAEAQRDRAVAALLRAGGDHWLRALVTGLRGRLAAAEGDAPAAAHLAAAALAFARRRLGGEDGRCRRLRVQWAVAMAAWTGPGAEAWTAGLKPDMRDELERGRREWERFPGLGIRAAPWTARAGAP